MSGRNFDPLGEDFQLQFTNMPPEVCRMVKKLIGRMSRPDFCPQSLQELKDELQGMRMDVWAVQCHQPTIVDETI